MFGGIPKVTKEALHMRVTTTRRIIRSLVSLNKGLLYSTLTYCTVHHDIIHYHAMPCYVRCRAVIYYTRLD